MSISLMSEVWRRECGALQGLLLALADHAKDDGTDVFPSVAHTAWKVERDRRTVQRQLRQLEQLGVLVEEAPATQHRSTRYRLDLTVLPAKEPFESQGRQNVTSDTEPGAAPLHPGAAPVLPRGGTDAALIINEPSEEPSGSSLVQSTVPERFFDEFWKVYPRRSGKLKAREAFFKALSNGTWPSVILEGARRYRDDPNREAQFTKHPATWLNQGCWDDDPLPERSNGKGVTAVQMAERAIQSARDGDESGPVGVREFIDAALQAVRQEEPDEGPGSPSIGGDHQSGVPIAADAGAHG